MCDYVDPNVSTNNKLGSDNTPMKKFDPYENISAFLD